MPFKSRAQEKYMNAAAARGEIKQSTVDEFNKASKGMSLPERAPKKKEKKKIKSVADLHAAYKALK